MTDIRYSGRAGKITCTPHEDINPIQPCIVGIEGVPFPITFTGAWGSDVVEVIAGAQLITLTWQEVKALERALSLLAHVITRTGNY